MSYSKLHSSLVNSSLWTEPDSVRILFITLLAMCDRQGFVYGSKPGIERLANIDPDTDAWGVLMSPDPDSSDRLRNPENEGRRIEEIPGGFRLLNFEYYRGLRNDDERREQTRNAVAKHRASQGKPASASVSQGKPEKAEVSQCKQIPSASASVSEKSKEEKKESTERKDDLAWLAELRDDPAYKGIDVAQEHAKATRWCKENSQQLTRRRFINWLNRCDKPLEVKFHPPARTTRYYDTRPEVELSDEQIVKNKAVIGPLVSDLANKLKMPPVS